MIHCLRRYSKRNNSPFRAEWAFLLLAIAIAAGLRFWQLGHLPPGLYRDEAYYGLDALRVLEGNHALFFPANNGREPLFIYLTALIIPLTGPTALSVRLGAALIGALTTWITYRLTASWFDARTALLAAFLWAITLWPVHLSRVGFRVVLLPALLALAFWLGARAYRRQRPADWLLAGLVYGLTFYTYLAARFTPLLVFSFFLYLWWTGRRRQLWPGVAWFGLAAGLTVAPLLLLGWQQPELFIGRGDQVSIFNPAIHQGDFWGTLGRQTGQALGMFLWQGDTILRHNPAGRPVFDALMALPFLAGLLWCLLNWRRPAATLALLWTGVMLGPTILAEDAPHFLRAAGVLPAVLIFPALGLSHLWTWTKLPFRVRQGLVIILLAGSLAWTINDYLAYAHDAETAYLFETAARDMAVSINNESADTAIYLDERFWQGWPSIQFLVESPDLRLFQAAEANIQIEMARAAFYVWPYESLNFAPQAFSPPALVSVTQGGLARGDLEETAYSLYTRYLIERPAAPPPILANFNNQLKLREVVIQPGQSTEPYFIVDLTWSAAGSLDQPLTVFVHLLDAGGEVMGQSDGPPAGGQWPHDWWQEGIFLQERRQISVTQPYERSQRRLVIGVYESGSQERLPLLDNRGAVAGDSWSIVVDP